MAKKEKNKSYPPEYEKSRSLSQREKGTGSGKICRRVENLEMFSGGLGAGLFLLLLDILLNGFVYIGTDQVDGVEPRHGIRNSK